MLKKLLQNRKAMKILLVVSTILTVCFYGVVVIPEFPEFAWAFILQLVMIFIYDYFYFKQGENIGKKKEDQTD